MTGSILAGDDSVYRFSPDLSFDWVKRGQMIFHDFSRALNDLFSIQPFLFCHYR
jgi:hypothetical protein